MYVTKEFHYHATGAFLLGLEAPVLGGLSFRLLSVCVAKFSAADSYARRRLGELKAEFWTDFSPLSLTQDVALEMLLQRAGASGQPAAKGQKSLMPSTTFTIHLEPAEEGGFIVTVPGLPEVNTCGDTEEEALAMAKEAIELVLEHRAASGDLNDPARLQRLRTVKVSTPSAA
jgi:predicted RNase H-like HicB family nuclease